MKNHILALPNQIAQELIRVYSRWTEIVKPYPVAFII